MLFSVIRLAKAYLLTFYTSCGFKLIRVSPVVHGAETWFELGLELTEARAHEMLQVIELIKPQSRLITLRIKFKPACVFSKIDAFTNTPFKGNPAA